MQGVERALPYGYSLWEMEVYGKSFQVQVSDDSNNEDSSVPSGTNVAKSAKATSSGNEADAMAAKICSRWGQRNTLVIKLCG